MLPLTISDFPRFFLSLPALGKSLDLQPLNKKNSKMINCMHWFGMECGLGRRVVQVLGVLFLSSCPTFLMAENNTPAPPAGPNLNLRQFQLLNGLQVVTANLTQTPSIAIQLLIKQGTSSLQGPPGIVALLASLWTDPAPNSPASQFREGEIPFAIQTDPDSITLRAECGPDALDFSLRLFAQLVMQSEVSNEDLERVRQQLVSRLENAGPLEQSRRKFAAALFGQHPYGQSGWGDPALIKKITREQILTFIKEQIKPNQSAIILTGSISNLELGDMIRSRLGAWVKGGREPQIPPPFTSRGDSVSLIGSPRDGGFVFSIWFGHAYSALYSILRIDFLEFSIGRMWIRLSFGQGVHPA